MLAQNQRDILAFRCAVALALGGLAAGCGGANASGVAIGDAGRAIASHAQSSPQGAEACAVKESLAAAPGGADKPISDTCTKTLKSDQLWRKSMVVLAAYADTLGGLSSERAGAGKLEAAGTGVSGSSWIEVDENDEKAAREAAAKLVEQMSSGSAEGDLKKAIEAGAPHVKTLCEGLDEYLGEQAQAFADARKDAEKKRASRNDRRCGTLDTRSVCVTDSAIDRVTYANVFGQLVLLESNHVEARNAVAGFCAAHAKLETAAKDGNLDSDDTYAAVVDAVKSAHRAKPPETSSETTEEPKADATKEPKADATKK